MARKKKTPFTFESNIDKITERIEKTPRAVMGKIGGPLVREIKATTLKSQFHQRRGILAKTLQWAYGWDETLNKKDKTSLQIGFKMSIPGIVGKMITGAESDPIKPVVVKNAQLIQDMIKVALDEIGKKGSK